MPKLNVVDISGKQVATIDLDDAVFAADVNEHLLWETVKWQQARKRRGTHSVKGRAEVSGTTKKPFKQKGTGRARAGSHRSPIWVGGGSVFGPRPRDYSYKMPKQARKSALCSALTIRAAEGKLIIVDAFPAAGGKTRNVTQALSAIGVARGALIVDVKDNEDLVRGTRNLPGSKWIVPEGINVYDVLKHDNLVMTQASAKWVEQALTQGQR